MAERETLEADVLIVGAGPAGLSCALRLAELAKQSATQAPRSGDSSSSAVVPENIFVIEKSDEIGAHCLSGAILDPIALRELVPDFSSQGAPLDAAVTEDSIFFFTPERHFKLPVTPPFLRNHGNYVISLSRFAKWLGQRVENAGVSLFPGFAGMEVLFDGDRVAGVRTGDKGLDRNGQPKSNYQSGYDLRAKVTVFAEGTHGSLTKQLVTRLGLNQGRNPPSYALGVKELWEIPPGRVKAGQVTHTAGWPLNRRQFGGGFIYAMSARRLSLGLVAGLGYADPQFDPHRAFQRWKTHPWMKRLLEGGQMIRYGAKTIPEGGYFSIPVTAVDGALIAGDAAGFLNSRRLKGIHLAMKTGMLAAETAFNAALKNDFSKSQLGQFESAWKNSWAGRELWEVRNYHQGFESGMLTGIVHAAAQYLTGGRGLHRRYSAQPDYQHLQRLAGIRAAPLAPIKVDGRLTFDKLADVYHSGTHHEEDQPAHLKIADFDICNNRCVEEFGNPCQRFCPAAVYEMAANPGGPNGPDGAGKRLKLNPSNCVHCKTCDIEDPYQIITWVCPEGGGGPHYDGM
jgi:electron-transferring-flavoprotein dehydrogenase